MLRRPSFILFVVIIALLAADFGLNGGRYTLFLAKKLFDLTDYIAFWR